MPNGRQATFEAPGARRTAGVPGFTVDPRTGRPISPAHPVSGQAFQDSLRRDPRFAHRFAQTLTQGQQLQRGARPGSLGQRQGPMFGGKPAFSPSARAALRPGMSLASQIRQLTGGAGRFGGARPAQGQRGTLSFGLLGKKGPASGGRFGTFGRAFGRLGNRGR